MPGSCGGTRRYLGQPADQPQVLDVGGPQRRRQRGEHATRSQHPRHLRHQPRPVRHDGDAQRRDHGVEAVVRERQVRRVAQHQGSAAAMRAASPSSAADRSRPITVRPGALQPLDHGSGPAGEVEHRSTPRPTPNARATRRASGRRRRRGSARPPWRPGRSCRATSAPRPLIGHPRTAVRRRTGSSRRRARRSAARSRRSGGRPVELDARPEPGGSERGQHVSAVGLEVLAHPRSPKRCGSSATTSASGSAPSRNGVCSTSTPSSLSPGMGLP